VANTDSLLAARYYRQGEHTWGDVVNRVAGHLYPFNPPMQAEAYEFMHSKRFLPSSPVLMNAGSQYPMLCSCFVLPVQDSIAALMESLTDTVMIQKYGGGVGLNFSAIRPEGSLVHTTQGKASGPVSFAGFWNEAMQVIRQGGKRQGAMMGVLNYDHKDLPLFLRAKETEGKLTNFNLSVGLTADAFKVDDVVLPHGMTAQQTLRAIAERAWHNGEPGWLYLDNINKQNPYIRCTH
jgi:ribonucleoside-diphosphate reductase alpha chain